MSRAITMPATSSVFSVSPPLIPTIAGTVAPMTAASGATMPMVQRDSAR